MLLVESREAGETMKYIAGGLAVLITIMLVRGILSLSGKADDSERHTVVLPRSLLIVGIICSTAYGIAAVIILLQEGLTASAAILFLFFLLSISLVLAYLNCRITYHEFSFTYSNFLGFKHTFSYDQITAIQGKTKDVKMYVGKRIVRIEEHAIGKYQFLLFAEKQYRKINQGQPIPTAVKKDLFNGNVEEPGVFIICYVLVGLLCIGAILFVAIDSAPRGADDLEYASLAFERYEIEDNSLHLYAQNDRMYYWIPAYDELLLDAEKFLTICDSGAAFEIGYILYDHADVPYYGVESIAGEDGTIYLTMEAIYNYHLGNIWPLYLILAGLGFVWFAYVAAAVYVGRHPERFSRRVIHMFFRDDDIRKPDNKTRKRST